MGGHGGSLMGVGVVIPAFNAARYVGEAIESVLAQTRPPSRIIVVDDGSVDDTALVAERFGRAVTCIHQQNRGVAAARNRGAREAGTEWIAFLDADDVWLPTKLEHQWERTLREPASAVFTGVQLVSEDLVPLPRLSAEAMRDDLEALVFHKEVIPQATSSTVLVRYPTYAAIGGYDENLSTMADWDLLIRLRLRTQFTYVAEPLVLYRRMPAGMSRNVELLEHDSTYILKKTFASPELPPSIRRLRRRCFGWNDLVLSGSYFHAGRLTQAVRLALRGMIRDPILAGRVLGLPCRHLIRGRNGGRHHLHA